MTSLRRRLLIAILAPTALVLGISGAAVFAIARSGLRAGLDAELAGRAALLAAMVKEDAPDPEEGDPGGVVLDLVGPIAQAAPGLLVRITDDTGRVLARSDDWPAGQPPREPDRPPGLPPMFGDTPYSDGRPGRGVSIVARPVRDEDDFPSDPLSDRLVLVEVIGPTASVVRAEYDLLTGLVAGGLVAAAGAAAAVWLGVRGGLAPVGRFSAALDRTGVGSLTDAPAPGSLPPELSPIAAAIGRLLARLRDAMDRERRFTDAAAHELRTPLAELRTLADVASRWPEPERLRRSLAEVGSCVDELRGLLDSLLAVARGAEAYAGQSPERVELAPVARSVAAPWADRLRDRRVSWAHEGDDRAAWMAPRGAVVSIVRNLVDNAAEHTPEGGSVTVSVRRDGGGAVVEVSSGPVNLHVADAGRMFEPFWRADAARTDRGRRGMGLAIVASLADSLGLRREAIVTPDRRLIVRVTGPAG